MEENDINLVEKVFKNYFNEKIIEIKKLSFGKINASFMVKTNENKFVLQRLSLVFKNSKALGENWFYVYNRAKEEELENKIPEIYKNKNGEFLTKLLIDKADWRLIEFIEGKRPEKNVKAASTAAEILASFHVALNNNKNLALLSLPNGEFTNHYLSTVKNFTNIIKKFEKHENFKNIVFLLERARKIALYLNLNNKFVEKFNEKNIVTHNDPKLDNFLCYETGEAKALFDWDTVGKANILIELAEFFRSWSYKAVDNSFDSNLAYLSLKAYQKKGLILTKEELSFLPKTVIAVALNLARRYLIDSILENYFNLEEGYKSLHEQNKAWAKQMLNLAENLCQNEDELINLFLS